MLKQGWNITQLLSPQPSSPLSLWQRSVQCVLAPAVLGPWVPTVRALRGLQTYHHPTTPTPLHIWSPSKRLHALAELRKRSSSWKLRKGEEERRKQKTAFQTMLQTFRGGSRGEGKGWVWKEEWIFEGPLGTWLWMSGVDFITHPVRSTVTFQLSLLSNCTSSLRKRWLVLITASSPCGYTPYPRKLSPLASLGSWTQASLV